MKQKEKAAALKKDGAAKEKQKKEEAFSSINTKSFLTVVALLVAILVACGLLTLVIPQGSFLRDAEGMIVEGSFVKGETVGIAPWRVITAPFRVFFSEDAVTIIMISIFLLIMSGVFNLLGKADGISVFIGKAVRKFSKRKHLVICVATLLFMLFGSFFGMFEELVTLLPLVIVLMLSLGFDTLTGLGVCMMAACFGFSAAITNPFSVGLVASIAGIHVMDGVWLRLIFFVIVFALVCTFLLWHTARIRKDPTRSLTYQIDKGKVKSLDLSVKEETPREKRIFKVYATFFIVQFIILILIAAIRPLSAYAVPLLAISFLFGGIVSGLLVCQRKRDTFKHILRGAVAMLPAVALIALASSVKLVMTESGILDTIMNGVISSLSGKSKFLCIVLIYFLILFLQIYIGSSSAKIMLILPIILPVCKALGLSPTIVMLTYCMADGFTDVILPTNPVLLIGLSMAKVSYGKWLRWTLPFQLLLFALTLLILLFAVAIGY